ncbi:CAF17-like 4Fe-4S cluster assembly/insertion protein YgfZ [Paludisphaera soli]|uniref:CAF17-like 4Fe-4S cluster assembly/insertion protein YgfZ n=1 Tax=Paludisphaera soli TaxID=2712865 RepID=UPI0021BCF21F|nr:glycine cleavage T C-terminal barrel domain-containing protein [Paludisphaera soli]
MGSTDFMSTSLEPYRAVDEAAAWIDRSARVRWDVSGPDAAKFLHNVTTNDVKRLATGRGCEAFVTSLQGKTLAYVAIVARSEGFLLRADAGGLDLARAHLQKYGVFDDVTMEDVSATTVEYHVAGPRAAEWLERAGGSAPEAGDPASTATRAGDVDVLCIRESPTGRPGFTLIAPAADAPALIEMMKNADLAELTAEDFEALRIEAGTPVFGREVTEKNLPQEIARDDRAISFVKGCYLGQETVARLDALGHVNKILKGLRFAPGDPTPSLGAALEADGKAVGTVSSAAFSPGWGAAVGLGIVRVAHAEPGTSLVWRRPEDGATFPASVADPPMLPPRS